MFAFCNTKLSCELTNKHVTYSGLKVFPNLVHVSILNTPNYIITGHDCDLELFQDWNSFKIGTVGKNRRMRDGSGCRKLELSRDWNCVEIGTVGKNRRMRRDGSGCRKASVSILCTEGDRH